MGCRLFVRLITALLLGKLDVSNVIAFSRTRPSSQSHFRLLVIQSHWKQTPEFAMFFSGRFELNTLAINQKMFKLILASMMLLMLVSSMSECIKRTQYHEQVSFCGEKWKIGHKFEEGSFDCSRQFDASATRV